MKKQVKLVVSLLITIAILAIIILKIGVVNLAEHFMKLNYWWFTFSVFLFIPIFMIIAKRWMIVIDDCYKLNFWSSIRIVLSSTALSAVTPSKLGDLSKAFFIKKKVPLKKGIGGVLFEKFMDVTALVIFSTLGILFTWKQNNIYLISLFISLGILCCGLLFFFVKIRGTFLYRFYKKVTKKTKFSGFLDDLYGFLSNIKHNKKKFLYIFSLSLASWFVQLLQIYLFFLSFNLFLNPFIIFGLVPVALLIGMIPITIEGVGTRDSALIVLFSEYAPSSLMFGIGILCSARLFFPALVGLLFLPRSIRKNF